MREYRIGDTISCKNTFEFGDAVLQLRVGGYDWEFMYEYDEKGNKQIIVEIIGRML